MIIGVDFDGTCVTHEFPNIGKEIGAVDVLNDIASEGHRIILFTMRSNLIVEGRNTLKEAMDWFDKHDIPIYGVNENPEQHTWTNSPKPYCHVYIDDAALGCPIKWEAPLRRPFVDWVKVRQILED
jgi:hypothetical protein